MRAMLIAASIAALAAPALAQSGQAAGLRYLDWPGKAPPRSASPPPRGEKGARATATQKALEAQPQSPASGAAHPPLGANTLHPALLPSREEGGEHPPPPKPLQSVDGSRRYSLHREYGQAPDRPQLPPEFFLDAVPVDLAEPPAQPLRERDERRLRAAAADPDSPQE